MAMLTLLLLGLFSSCNKQGLLSLRHKCIVVVASRVVEHRLESMWSYG